MNANNTAWESGKSVCSIDVQSFTAATMQLHNRSSLTCRHRLHSAVATSTSKARLVIASARSRRTALPSPQDGSVSPEQPSDTTSESAAAAAATAPAAVPLVRSSRRATSPAASRNKRGTAQRPVVSPAQTLKDKGVIATNADGCALLVLLLIKPWP